MTKQTKAKAITKTVKKAVWARDNGECIICHSPDADPSCHYIRRSQGGLGIEQNIVTLCARHHLELDSPNSPAQQALRTRVRLYLNRFYPDFSDEDRVYKK